MVLRETKYGVFIFCKFLTEPYTFFIIDQKNIIFQVKEYQALNLMEIFIKEIF